MKITVAIPSYKRPLALSRAIRSCLAQTLPPTSIVVGDDAADTETESVCRAFNDNRIVHVPRHSLLRMTENWDFVTRWAADGTVALLEDDNFWDPSHLEVAARGFAKHPNASLVHAGHREAHDTGARLEYYRTVTPPWSSGDGEPVEASTGDVIRDALLGGSINASTVVFQRKALDSVPGFDARYLMGMDTLMWCRVALKGAVVYSGSVTVTYTYHKGNVSGAEIRSRRAGAQARASRRIVAREALAAGALTAAGLRAWLMTLPPEKAGGVLTAFLGGARTDDLTRLALEVWSERKSVDVASRYLSLSRVLGSVVVRNADTLDAVLSSLSLIRKADGPA